MKKFATTILLFVLLVTLQPEFHIGANEFDENITMQSVYDDIKLGTSAITKDNTIYYGKYTDNTAYPVEWIVLNNTTLLQTSVAGGSSVIPLISKHILGNSIFREPNDTGYYNYSTATSTIASSTLKNRMESLYNGNSLLTAAEQSGVVNTTLLAASMFTGQSNIENQKLFPLSYDEAYQIGGEVWQQPIQIATYINDPTGNSIKWRLRYSYDDLDAYCVYEYGIPGIAEHSESYGVRPAFHLNRNTVSFISAAVGGKISGNVGESALHSNTSAYEISNYKLTLLNNSAGSGRENFTVSTISVSTTTNGGTVSINYNNAKSGTNEYLSAFITDSSNNVLYYGRLKNILSSGDVSGSQNIVIPSGLTAGTYTLKVFNEQYNGDMTTDYTSDFGNVTLTVSEPITYYTLTVDLDGGSGTTTGGNYQENTVIPINAGTKTDYIFNSWLSSDGGYFDNAKSSSTNIHMPANDTTITATWTTTLPYAVINYTSLAADASLTAVLENGTATEFRWQKYNNDTLVWEDISSADTNQYLATITDVNKQIRVIIKNELSVEYQSDPVTILSPIISVTVPVTMQVRLYSDGRGVATDLQRIENDSTIDMHISEIRLDWEYGAELYFYNISLVDATVKLGGTTGTEYTLNQTNPLITPIYSESFIAKNGGRLDMTWEYQIKSGNYVKRLITSGTKYQIARIYYTIE